MSLLASFWILILIFFSFWTPAINSCATRRPDPSPFPPLQMKTLFAWALQLQTPEIDFPKFFLSFVHLYVRGSHYSYKLHSISSSCLSFIFFCFFLICFWFLQLRHSYRLINNLSERHTGVVFGAMFSLGTLLRVSSVVVCLSVLSCAFPGGILPW